MDESRRELLFPEPIRDGDNTLDFGTFAVVVVAVEGVVDIVKAQQKTDAPARDDSYAR